MSFFGRYNDDNFTYPFIEAAKKKRDLEEIKTILLKYFMSYNDNILDSAANDILRRNK